MPAEAGARPTGPAEDTAPDHPAAPRPVQPRSGAVAVGRLALMLLVVVLVTTLVRSLVVTPFSIPSGSMAQTLQVGDRILVDRLTYRFGDVSRGDVVVFDGTDTFGSLGGAAETDYVKRVVGLPGDRVVCCDRRNRLTVNGSPLDERAYLHPGDQPSEQRFDVMVPAGRLWLMGDHRSDSLDSRSHLGDPGGGTVSLGKVVGRVRVVVWPPARFGTVPVSGPEALDLPTGP